MFCSQCGNHLEEGAQFCSECGTKILPEEPIRPNTAVEAPLPANTTQPTPSTTPPAIAIPLDPVALSRPTAAPTINNNVPSAVPTVSAPTHIRSFLTAIGTSPLFLVAAIAYSVSLFFQLINAFNGSNDIVYTLNQLASQFGIRSFVGEYLDAISAFFSTMTLISTIPYILISVGIWITFAKLKGKPINADGLSIIKIVSLVQLILFCIGIFIIECGLIGITSQLTTSRYTSSFSGIGFAAIIIVAGIAAVMIFYYTQLLKTIDAFRDAVNNDKLSDSISPFVAVICFISGGFSALAVFQGGSLLLINLCSAVAMITFGIFLFSYRTKVREWMSIPTGQGMPENREIQQTVCEKCGAPLQDGSMFCARCGAQRHHN